MKLPLIVPSDFFDYGDKDPQCAILEWRFKKGDAIALTHVLCSILVSKGTVEYECPYDGILVEIRIPSVPDSHIDDISAILPEYRHPPNTVICYIETNDARDPHFSPEVIS